MSPITRKIKVISRSSRLALKQVAEVFAQLPDEKKDIHVVETFGDKNKNISLLHCNTPDFFTRELDQAVLDGTADLAVHSAKDLPYPLPEGLEIAALFKAFDNTDALVSKKNLKLIELPLAARVGTSSMIRKNELLKLRPDLQIVSVRGTIDERINQLENGSYDALVVATCALMRLELTELIGDILPFETHPLQGNLAVVVRTGDTELLSLFKPFDIRHAFGHVILAGFGPGDPDLITVKTLKSLETADIIYFDDLIDKVFIERFKAEKIYVGKRKGNHSIEQSDINKLLYTSAFSGKNVVRLKGGDPMIFAHGGEEIEYLQERLIKVSVISGVSAGLAAAASLGISLTHRDISGKVSFISGHSAGEINFPVSGTVVCYMSAANLSKIATDAIRRGWLPATPVALVHNVTLPTQAEFYATLQEIAVSEALYPTPLIVIIGDVVGLKRSKAVLLAKPNVLVTGTDTKGFAEYGNVIHQPLIEIRSLKEISQIKNNIDLLTEFDYVVFTSKHTVEHFFEILDGYKKNSGYISSRRIVSIGTSTTAALKAHGVNPDLQPVDESSEGIIQLFKNQKIHGKVVFIPRSNIALPILPEGLRDLGNTVITVSVYTNELPEETKPINLKGIQYIAFSSPSGVDNFMRVYKNIPDDTSFIAKGLVTKNRMLEVGFPKEKIKSFVEKDIYEVEFEI